MLRSTPPVSLPPVCPTPISNGGASIVNSSLAAPPSKASKLLAAALESAPANFVTRQAGLNRFFGCILKAQPFRADRNEVFCPFSAWESLFAVQRFNGSRIYGEWANYLSPEPKINTLCRNAYFRERDESKFDIYSFGERIAGIIRKADLDAKEALNDLYKQPHIKVFPTDPSSRKDIIKTTEHVKGYVRVQTDGFLKEVGGLVILKKDQRCVLMGAANLVARWEQPFNPRDTIESDFYMDDGQKITVDMMTQKYVDGLLNANPGEGYEFMFARPFNSVEEKPVIMLYALPREGVSPEEQAGNREKLLQRIAANGLVGLGLDPVIADSFSVPKFDMQQTRDVAFPVAGNYLHTSRGAFSIRQTARFEHGEGLPGSFWMENHGGSHRRLDYVHAVEGVPGTPELHVELKRPFDAIVLLPGGLIWHVLRVAKPVQSTTKVRHGSHLREGNHFVFRVGSGAASGVSSCAPANHVSASSRARMAVTDH